MDTSEPNRQHKFTMRIFSMTCTLSLIALSVHTMIRFRNFRNLPWENAASVFVEKLDNGVRNRMLYNNHLRYIKDMQCSMQQCLDFEKSYSMSHLRAPFRCRRSESERSLPPGGGIQKSLPFILQY